MTRASVVRRSDATGAAAWRRQPSRTLVDHAFPSAPIRCVAALALVLGAAPALGQAPLADVVVGEVGSWPNLLICRTVAARNALIVYAINEEKGVLPSGCALENLPTLVRGISPGTAFHIPARNVLPDGRVQNLRLPMAFMVVDVIPSGPRHVYAAYFTNISRVVRPDGRPGPELRDP
jgi:hypothetical protein